MLVKIQTNEQGEQLVSARVLHEKLEVKTRFDTWIKRKIIKYGFVENTDFTTVDQKRATAQGNKTELKDYILKLDMAKEISMIENNDKGREIRQYFIKCEKKYLELVKKEHEIEFNPNLRRIQESVIRIKGLEEKIRDLQKEIAKEYRTISGRAVVMEDTVKNGELYVLTLKEYKKD